MSTYQEIIQKIKPELDKVMSFFNGELMKIRTGYASPALVEDMMVECFGKNMPLKQLGAISSSGPRQILIQPWDKSYVEAIEKAFSRSGIGGSVILDQDVMRVSFPPLTEEFRKDLIRLLSEKQEEARKTIRRWREEAWRETQDEARNGIIREDDKFRAKDKLQELMDEYNGKIKEIGERKEKEIIG